MNLKQLFTNILNGVKQTPTGQEAEYLESQAKAAPQPSEEDQVIDNFDSNTDKLVRKQDGL